MCSAIDLHITRCTHNALKLFGKSAPQFANVKFNIATAPVIPWLDTVWDLNCGAKVGVIEVLTLMRPLFLQCSFV